MPDLSAWGNPQQTAYRTSAIRIARGGGTEILVHADIVDLTSALLTLLAKYVDLPYSEFGWRAPEGREIGYREYGLGVEIPTDRLPSSVERQAALLGFTMTDKGFEFRGTRRDADRLTERYRANVVAASAATQAAALDRQAANEARIKALRAEESWSRLQPGLRQIGPGCKGDDVQFVQAAIGCHDYEGVWSTETTDHWGDFLRRRGYPPLMSVTWEGWDLLLSSVRRHQFQGGESGADVRLIQAYLIAYGWGLTKVTGTYGTPTTRAVRALQKSYEIRQTGKWRAAEWAIIPTAATRSEVQLQLVGAAMGQPTVRDVHYQEETTEEKEAGE